MNKWINKWFPPFFDPPENGNVISGVCYAFFCLISFPFILLLFMQGSFSNPKVITWCEIFYHAVNFVVSILIFRHYLYDSFLEIQIKGKQILKNVLIVALVAVILALEIGNHAASADSGFSLAFYGMLPIVEIDMFVLPIDMLYYNPVFGMLCLVVFTPVTISCLYYGTVFAPICQRSTWLAYVVTAIFIAIPRLCNGATHWIMEEQIWLYLCQLPLHMLGCWTFQKNGTIWAPIFLHMIANLVGCIGWIVAIFA